MIIAIANDHAATDLKNVIKIHLEEQGHTVLNLGTDDYESTHYPLYAKKVCQEITAGKAHLGILICGTGLGMNISANKFHGIRAVACSEPYSAKLAREHNNANVLCFGARVVGDELAKMICDNFLEAAYLGDRHQIRLDMIKEFENDY